jgi:hypothetical protein
MHLLAEWFLSWGVMVKTYLMAPTSPSQRFSDSTSIVYEKKKKKKYSKSRLHTSHKEKYKKGQGVH